jgi:hypothetical protein
VQLSGWWFLTFTASEIKDKIQYLNGVQYLYDTINPDQIEIPPFVFDFDRQVSATIMSIIPQPIIHVRLCLVKFENPGIGPGNKAMINHVLYTCMVHVAVIVICPFDLSGEWYKLLHSSH